jgi:histidinol-phosphatase (PHP family)
LIHPYLAAIERCRNCFGDRLTIRAGVEMGEPHIFVQQSEDMLAAGEFDFVIG